MFSLNHSWKGEPSRIIRQDSISGILIAYAALAIIWLGTFSTTTVVMFPFILLVGGIALEYRFSKKIGEPAQDTRRLPFSQIGMYAGLALAVIFITGAAVQYLPAMALPSPDSLLYSTSIAVAEEQFFRGFITDGLLSYPIPFLSNVYVKLAISGGIFALYHYARYGTSMSSLIYVFAGGFMLSWVAWKTKRLSPSMIAHVCNNLIALVGV